MFDRFGQLLADLKAEQRKQRSDGEAYAVRPGVRAHGHAIGREPGGGVWCQVRVTPGHEEIFERASHHWGFSSLARAESGRRGHHNTLYK